MLRQESRWAPRGLTFEMDLPRLRCRANAEMLGHVWDNLIGNAVKFSHDGGCIHIRGRTEGEKENAFVNGHDPRRRRWHPPAGAGAYF